MCRDFFSRSSADEGKHWLYFPDPVTTSFFKYGLCFTRHTGNLTSAFNSTHTRGGREPRNITESEKLDALLKGLMDVEGGDQQPFGLEPASLSSRPQLPQKTFFGGGNCHYY